MLLFIVTGFVTEHHCCNTTHELLSWPSEGNAVSWQASDALKPAADTVAEQAVPTAKKFTDGQLKPAADKLAKNAVPTAKQVGFSVMLDWPAPHVLAQTNWLLSVKLAKLARRLLFELLPCKAYIAALLPSHPCPL